MVTRWAIRGCSSQRHAPRSVEEFVRGGGFRCWRVTRRLDGLVRSTRPHPPLDFRYRKIEVANLEALQLSANSGKVVAQQEDFLLLGQRFVNGGGDLRADFSYG